MCRVTSQAYAVVFTEGDPFGFINLKRIIDYLVNDDDAINLIKMNSVGETLIVSM